MKWAHQVVKDVSHPLAKTKHHQTRHFIHSHKTLLTRVPFSNAKSRNMSLCSELIRLVITRGQGLFAVTFMQVPAPSSKSNKVILKGKWPADSPRPTQARQNLSESQLADIKIRTIRFGSLDPQRLSLV